jgi:hypothetical protein
MPRRVAAVIILLILNLNDATQYKKNFVQNNYYVNLAGT